MFTLCICYTIDPNKLADFKTYVSAELEPIRRCGGSSVQYFYPTDYAGPTSAAYGLIDFQSLTAYETYRAALGADAAHESNAEALRRSGAVLSMLRSFIERAE